MLTSSAGDRRVVRRTKQEEEWRLVEGSDDYYISNLGNFRHGKKKLKTSLGLDGYPRCNLGKLKKRVHRLVAEAFIPNPDNLPIVDHIDGNKTNNSVSNLRWVDYQTNTQAAYDMGLFANVNAHRHESVGVFKEDNSEYVFDTLVQASEFSGVPVEGVSKCLRGIEKQRKGYRFMRVNELHDYREKKG